MPFTAGSAEELAANAGEFQLLPDDEYKAEVTSVAFDSKEGKPAGLYGPAQDQYIFDLKILSFADGSDLEDTEGKPVEDFTLRTFINHNKMGMVPQPSKARKFMAAILQQPLGNRIEVENFPDDFIGKQLFVSTINKKTDKGEWTRVQDFRPLRIVRRTRSAATQGATEGEQEQAEGTNNVAIDDDEIKF